MTAGWNSRAFYRDLGVPALLAPLIWWLFDAAPVDRWLIAPYYDAVHRAFPLRDDPLLENVMHGGLRWLVLAVAIGMLGAFLLSYLVPQLPRHRRRLLWLFAGMAGSTLLVSTIKHYSALHCPWDLEMYGGYAPFHALFDRLPGNVAPGRCFPGGHAAGGFALMAFHFALRDTHATGARIGLAAGLLLGTAMGWAQMMRGAHFLSHTVWAAWLTWVFLAALYHALPPRARFAYSHPLRVKSFSSSTASSTTSDSSRQNAISAAVSGAVLKTGFRNGR